MKRKTFVAGILAAGLLAGVLPALIPATQAAGSGLPGGGGGKVTLCQAGQQIHIDGPWGNYVLKNNDFNLGPAGTCVTHYRSGPDFRVTRSRAQTGGPESMAYPNLYTGCSFGRCAHGGLLPTRVFRMRNPWVSWYGEHLRPHGRWDANLDMWLSRHKQKTGLVTGAEVMIWVNTQGFGAPRANVKVDGIPWHLVHWITSSPLDRRVHWPLIIFRAVPGRTHVKRLALLPFFRKLRSMGLIHSGYWLDSVHAGFEIWTGGHAMKLQWFRLHTGKRR